MFERFTDSARRVVVLAQEEARMLGHRHVGSEHLLLGLLHEQGGIAARALQDAGIAVEAARDQIGELVGRGEKPLSGHIPFTPRAKKILELSLREALEQKARYIGTEHLLLALMRDTDGPGAQVVERLGGSLPALRQRVLEMVRDAAPESSAAGEWEGGPEAGLRRLLLPRGQGEFGHEPLVRPETIVEFRGRLTSFVRRLENIERQLGIAAAQNAPGGLSGLLMSVDRHLGNLERHFGLSGEVPGPADEPPAAAD